MIGLLTTTKVTRVKELNFTNEYFYSEVRDGFYVSEMMKRFWAAQLEVLKVIDDICQKHGLRWFANYGTMLGAVRHEGYIPWDDDLDITMLRYDYDKFFEVAKQELPKDYCILTTSEHEEYAYPYGRVTNSHSIDLRPEHLSQFHGCPYVVGVDIYPYDKMFEDKRLEEDRDRRGYEIFKAVKLLTTSNHQNSAFRELIKKIEKENHTRIKMSGNIPNHLIRLIEKISLEANGADCKEIAPVYSWILYRKYRFPSYIFEKYTELPFECTSVIVPEKYDDLLTRLYKDYTKKVMQGGNHNYPVFAEQERIYREQRGVNPYRYTLKTDSLSGKRSFTVIKPKCREIISLLVAMHNHLLTMISSGNVSELPIVLNACQTSAVSLGNSIEKKYLSNANATVKTLEDYCEAVYDLSLHTDVNKIGILNELVSRASSEIENLFESSGKDILFLPCRIQWWDTLKPIFEGAVADKRNTISAIPIPYFDCDYLGNIGEVHINETDFSNIPKLKDYITSFESYGIESRHPDVIVIQFPFDGSSCSITIPEQLYSDNLLKYTDDLVYVPCFDTIIPESENDRIVAALQSLIEQPAVVNADHIILKHEKIKETYLRALINLTSNDYEEYWQNKLRLISEIEWLKGS